MLFFFSRPFFLGDERHSYRKLLRHQGCHRILTSHVEKERQNTQWLPSYRPLRSCFQHHLLSVTVTINHFRTVLSMSRQDWHTESWANNTEVRLPFGLDVDIHWNTMYHRLTSLFQPWLSENDKVCQQTDVEALFEFQYSLLISVYFSIGSTSLKDCPVCMENSQI